MCLSPHNEYRAVHEARLFVDRVLGDALRINVRKALDLATPQGFDRAVASFAAQLARATSASDLAAVKAATQALDVDWGATTPAQRRALVDQALRAARLKLGDIPKTIEARVGKAAPNYVRTARVQTIDQHGLRASVDLTVRDQRVVEHVTRTQSLFVTDEYGRRLDDFGLEAQGIVADGLEAGLGRDDIAAQLSAAARGTIAGRSASYWDVVAGAFVAESRSWAQLNAYSDAGISVYLIEAVLDERTTEVCRFLDGKRFSVGDGIAHFDRLSTLSDPDEIKASAPWVREGKDADGKPVLYTGRGEDRSVVARVDSAGFGEKDRIGSYSGTLSEKEMQDLGVSWPPYHGLCRTTTVPDIS